MQKPLIILDRDGVINEDSDAYIKSLEEWIPLPGSIDAIARLSKAGYTVAVATNQSGIARGYYDEAVLQQMHDKLNELVQAKGGKIACIVHCPHGPDDTCDCRKPLPGLVHQIERLLGVSAQGGYMVGDSLRDLEAGQAAGCHGVLVRTGKGEKTLQKGAGLEGCSVFDDLSAFVDSLVS